MRLLPIVILLVHRLATVGADVVSVGIIHNVSLGFFNASTTIINGSCEECVCSLLANTSFFSLSCFHDNLTCQLHSQVDQNKPFTLSTSSHVSFYFVSLPTYTPPQVLTVEYFWSFDSTFQDRSATFNGTPINNPTFSSSTITGYGSSLSLLASLNQSVRIHQPFLELFN